MSISTVNITYSSQIKYDLQGVQLSTPTSHLFVSKLNISSITNNTSSISIIFHHNPVEFTITSSQNYLINNIYNNLTNITQSSQSSQSTQQDNTANSQNNQYGPDSYSEIH